MHASIDLRWYLASLLWFYAVRGWYVVEGTTLRYDRNIGNNREPVPSARYHQAISGDKEVVRGTTLVYDAMQWASGDGRMAIHENSTQLKDTIMRYNGTTIPRSTTSSYYQDRSIGKEVVLEQNNTAPAALSNERVIDDRKVPVQVPRVIQSSAAASHNRGKGERDVHKKKSETNNLKSDGGTTFERQDVIKGTTFKYKLNELLEGTTEHGERKIVDNGSAGKMLNTTIDHPLQTSNNATSQDAPVSGRKIKIPRPNSQTMQYLLVPGFLMAGILPWVMPKLQMVAMMLSMVNNMAFTSALFTLIRNFIFERESAQHVLYINNGYRKKNRHRHIGKPYKEHYEHQEYHEHHPGLDHNGHSANQAHHEAQGHDPSHYEHQEYHEHHPGLDYDGHSAHQAHHEDQGHAPIHYEHQEYHEHSPSLDHHGLSTSQVHHEYQELQEHPPIGWQGQGFSKFSEKWRRSSNTS